MNYEAIGCDVWVTENGVPRKIAEMPSCALADEYADWMNKGDD